MEEQRQRCPRCGTYQWEWGEGGHLHPYEGDLYKCWGCAQLDIQQVVLRDSSSSIHGLYPVLYPSNGHPRKD